MSDITKPIMLDETGQDIVEELQRITAMVGPQGPQGNPGAPSTITMNGTTYTHTAGNIDLGTVVTSIPTASTTQLGAVKVDGSTITIADGVISSSGGSADFFVVTGTFTSLTTFTTDKKPSELRTAWNAGKKCILVADMTAAGNGKLNIEIQRIASNNNNAYTSVFLNNTQVKVAMNDHNDVYEGHIYTDDIQYELTASTGINITDDTISATAFTGATSAANGTLGAVPAPTIADKDKFLKGDGSWAAGGSGAGGTVKYISDTAPTGASNKEIWAKPRYSGTISTYHNDEVVDEFQGYKAVTVIVIDTMEGKQISDPHFYIAADGSGTTISGLGITIPGESTVPFEWLTKADVVDYLKDGYITELNPSKWVELSSYEAFGINTTQSYQYKSLFSVTAGSISSVNASGVTHSGTLYPWADIDDSIMSTWRGNGDVSTSSFANMDFAQFTTDTITSPACDYQTTFAQRQAVIGYDTYVYGDAWSKSSGDTVTVNSTGTATDEIRYITVNGTEKKIYSGAMFIVSGTKPAAGSTGTLDKSPAAVLGNISKGVPVFLKLSDTTNSKEYFYIITNVASDGSTVLYNSTASNVEAVTLAVVSDAYSVTVSTIPASSDVFIATYNTTTYADITAAVAANKVVLGKYGNDYYQYMGKYGTRHAFGRLLDEDDSPKMYVLDAYADGQWGAYGKTIQETMVAGEGITINGVDISVSKDEETIVLDEDTECLKTAVGGWREEELEEITVAIVESSTAPVSTNHWEYDLESGMSAFATKTTLIISLNGAIGEERYNDSYEFTGTAGDLSFSDSVATFHINFTNNKFTIDTNSTPVDNPDLTVVYANITYTYHPLDGRFLPIDGTSITLNSSGQLQASSSDTWRNITVDGTNWKDTATTSGAMNVKHGTGISVTPSGNDLTIASTTTFTLNGTQLTITTA